MPEQAWASRQVLPTKWPRKPAGRPPHERACAGPRRKAPAAESAAAAFRATAGSPRFLERCRAPARPDSDETIQYTNRDRDRDANI